MNKKKSKNSEPSPFVTRNRKAFHDYEIIDQIECGVILYGSEVKSVRDHKVTLDDSFAMPKDGELWVIGMHIGEYAQASLMNHLPLRERKLLLHKRELNRITSKTKDRGVTLVPLDVHFNERGIVKILLGVARGRKEFDKRDVKRKADAQKEIRNAMMTKRR